MVVLNPRFRLMISREDKPVANVRGLKSARVTMTKKEPADVCQLDFPNAREITFDLFEKGDVVDLWMGYKEFGVYPVFIGEVKEVAPNLPLHLKCESAASKSKKGSYTKTYVNEPWHVIAADAFERSGLTARRVPHKPATDPPGLFRVDNETPAQVLDRCVKETGWSWYAVPGTEEGYFGPPQEELEKEAQVFLYTVGENAYADDCRLEYVAVRRIKKVVVTLADADYQTAPVIGEFEAPGYEEGDPVKRLQYTVSRPSKAKADDRAKQEYLHVSIKGYKGSFRAVGNPLIRQGSNINLVVPKYDNTPRRTKVENVDHVFEGGVYDMVIQVEGGED
ncbi:MAG: hypothetical protein V3W11_06340 [bacterium]